MNDPYRMNSDLGRRQHESDIGFIRPEEKANVLRPLYLCIALLLLSVALVLWSPVPGLGALLAMGAAIAIGPLALQAWLGK